MSQQDREKLLELAARQGEFLEKTYLGDTFVTHRDHRIFFNWHPTHGEWFFIVYRTGVAATTGYPVLGCDWFKSWDSWAEGLAWGRQLIDSKLQSTARGDRM